jgi:predicted RNase H-like HicB family nuclease
MATYIALVHQIAVGRCRVSFPDLPGCVAAGDSLQEAIATAKQALADHVQHLLEAGEPVPVPSLVDAIERQDAVLVAAIEVPDDLTTKEINLAVPGLALRRFDLFAEGRGMTRSAVFVEAVNRWIVQETAAIAKSEVPHGPAPDAAGHPTVFDIEAIRRELTAEDHRDAMLPDDFETDGLPGPQDHTDEIKAEMMRLLETRSAPPASPSQSEEQPKETGDRKRS